MGVGRDLVDPDPKKVLRISVTETGLVSALPPLVGMFSKLLIGPLDDKLISKILCEQSKVKLFSGVAQYGICISLLGLAFIPYLTSSILFILPFYSTINMFTGLDFLGIFRYAQFIALKHSEVLISWTNIVISIVPLILPGIVAAAAPDDTIKQWTYIFSTISILVFTAITVFILFAKSNPRKWALEINNNNTINIIKEKEIDKQKEEDN
uniref:Uncharacterized protein n=2 Tax=Meloidogyne TaxID=189290 RepID=A0A914MAQ5_MELIC